METCSMESALEFLGFTDPWSTLWNLVAYGFVALLIFATLREKYRYEFLGIGAMMLASYSYVFLHNTLFTTLQIVIMISALLQSYSVSPNNQKITLSLITVCAVLFLLLSGNLKTYLDTLGLFGLWGIAFGIIMLPRLGAFLVMAVGGFALVLYALALSIWPFLVLNVFYTLANVWQWSTLKERERWIQELEKLKEYERRSRRDILRRG